MPIKTGCALLLAVLWCLPVAFCDEATESTDLVLTLTEANFDDTVKNAEIMLVDFYSPWCVHCHTVDRIYKEAAIELASHGVQLARVDTSKETTLKQKYQITQVPTFKVFRKGQVFSYEGPNEDKGAKGIVDYMLQQKARRHLAESVVLELTQENFDATVNQADLILVEFYADWCIHCQNLEPHFAAAARRLLANEPPVLLGRVKIPEQLEVAKRFGVSGYPLLFMFRHGKTYNYTGPREEDDVKQFSSSDETRAVAFFSAETSGLLVDAFIESGNFARDIIKLGHVTNGAIAMDMGIPLNSVVVFHPRHLVTKYESGRSIFRDLSTNATAMSEMYATARPLVGQVTKDNVVKVYAHRPLLVAYFEVDWSREGRKSTQYWHTMLASVAKDFTNTDIVFAIANEADFPGDLQILGLSDWGEDVAVGLFATKPAKYRMSEELSPSSLRDFVQDYLQGSLEPYLTSELPPREAKNALVKTVVGSTFKKVVLNSERNVVIKLCVPTGETCTKAKEWYPKVAEKFKGVGDLVFAEMNVALNDPPLGTNYDSLPVFYFSARGSTEMVPVTPTPADDADLQFYLKHTVHIKPIKKAGKEEL
eukprot:Em0004g1421a